MKKRLVSLMTAGLLGVSLLAGCGSSQATESTATAETTEETSQAATEETAEAEGEAEEAAPGGEVDKVTVAFMPNYASTWDAVVADKEGYFAEQNIEVEFVMFQDGPTEIASMESGSVDIAYIGPGAHSLCIQGKATIFAFDHLGNADSVVGLKSHGVETLEDLAGKTVGYASGTTSETILVRALNSVGLTLDDINAYDMDISNMASAMMSGSLDACAIWSPNTAVVTSEMDGDAFVMCSNTTFADIAADCCSWIVTPDYATANEDLLVRFTKALYKGMDFGCKEENYETVAGYVAELCGTDKDTALGQTGDGAWLDAATLVGYVEDGTVEGYYEVQQKGFIDSGKITAEEGTDVSNYVLFDIMTKAAE